MFVRLLAKHSTQPEGAERFRSFDATRIITVYMADEPTPGCFFIVDFKAFDKEFYTPTYDEAGLVELVMQARLNPDAFLPSNNVGKDRDVELGSTGSHHWSNKK